LRLTGARSGRTAFECEVTSIDFRGSFRQGCSDLIIGQVGLSRIGEQRKDSSDSLCGSSLAGRDHNAEINEIVIDLTTSRLDDVDIFASD